MNKITLFFTLLIISITGFISKVEAQNFKHPGLLHTSDDFNRIRTQLAANNQKVVAGYNNLLANPYSSSTTISYPVEYIIRGGGSGENYINAARGAAMAYQNALRWHISGEDAHAKKAVEILNAWANNCKGVGGDTNLSLAAGLYGYQFANAAELMRNYSGWTSTDFDKFTDWMLTVWYPVSLDFLARRHETWKNGRPGHYWSNWGLCNVLAVISIGVLCDDVYIYNQGIDYYKNDLVGSFKNDRTPPIWNDGLNEFLGNLVPVVYEDSRGPYGYLGQMQESGRDQGHTLMALGLAVDICQIAWNQGDDLFSHMNNRLAAGIEYVAAYNTGINDLPWSEYRYCDVRTAAHNAWVQTGNNEGGRGQFRPFWDRILGHYEGIKGVKMTYSEEMSEKIGADFGGSGGTSGGYDHLGFTTLTSTRSAIPANNAPTFLKPVITYNSKTEFSGICSGVIPGSVVLLSPQLPEGESNTGHWNWNTGDKTQNLSLVANRSGIYNVEYINSNGITSTQSFSIAVYGDCTPSQLGQSIKYNKEVINDSVIHIISNSSVELSVWSLFGNGSFLWNDGTTGNSLKVENITQTTDYSVEFTNTGGAKSKASFTLEIMPIAPYIKINGVGENIRSVAFAVKGQDVELKPTVLPGNEGGSWVWSDGSTNQKLILNNIQTTQEHTVYYSLNGKQYPLDFKIYVEPFDGAFAYWAFNENNGNHSIDVWGGYRGELYEAAQWTNGCVQAAVRYDGNASSYIQLPDNVIDDLSDFTISTWIKQNEAQNWTRIWDFGSGTESNMFLTPRNGSNAKVRFGIKKDNGAEQQINTTIELPNGQWTHIAVSKSGNTGILYINGAEAGRNDNITISPSDLGKMNRNYLGKSQYSDPLFKGVIDEFRIYSKALSMDEISDLYNKIDIPSIPENLTGAFIEQSARLQWNAVPDATYSIRKASEKEGPFSLIASGIETNEFSDSDIENGRHYYTLFSTINKHEGNFSDTLLVSTYDLPSRINNFASEVVSSKEIKLTWEALPDSEFINGYTIERSLHSGDYFATIATGINSLEYIDKDLSENTNYYYRIYASNFFGNGIFSKEIHTSTTALEVPGIPDKLKADAGYNMVRLVWEKAKDAYTYNVLRATTPNGPYISVADGVIDNQFTDKTAQNDTTYYYVVISKNPVFESEYSREVSATPSVNAWIYYPLDEVSENLVVADIWNNKNAALMGTFNQIEGISERAVQLTGNASSYIKLPEDNNLSSFTDFTIMVWVKLDKKANWARIWDFGNGTSKYMFLSTNTGNVNGPVRFAIKNGVTEQQVNCSHVLNTDEWTHIAVTKSGNIGILYINGVEVGRNSGITISPSDLGTINQAYLGKSQWSADAMFSGSLDEVRIYSRGLQASEIGEIVGRSAPNTPKGMNALSWDRQVDLSWQQQARASDYIIKRSLSESGPFIKMGETSTFTFSDTVQLENNRKYYYTLTAVSAGGEESPDSEIITATPVGKSLYNDLTHSDVGEYVLTGNSGFSEDGIFTMYGAGSQIYQKKDGFHYTYKQVSGDVAIVAKVLSISNTNVNAKAGVMIREQLTANSMTAVSSVRADNQWEIVYRTSNNGNTTHPMEASHLIPQWVKTMRIGNEFKSYISKDGITWQEHANGRTTINMSNPVYVGVFALSHTLSDLTKAQYDRLTISTALPEISGSLSKQIKPNVGFDYNIMASNEPYMYLADNLPDGLSIDSITGKISGMPLEFGSFEVALKAINAMGEATAVLNLEILASPLSSRWFSENGSSDWFDSSNWSDGVPGVGTKVTITKSDAYPVLTEPTSVANIYFEAGAELGRQDLLTCDKAFVDYDFGQGSRSIHFHSLSVPLMEAFAGDFTFGGQPDTYIQSLSVDENGRGKWIALSGGNSSAFTPGTGFALSLDPDKDSDKGLSFSGGILRLPFFDSDSHVDAQVHPNHTYANWTSTFTNPYGAGFYTVTRSPNAFKLAGAEVNVNPKFGQSGGKFIALVGNPFMKTIDFTELQADNASLIKNGYQIWTKVGNQEGYTGYTPDGNWGLVTIPELDKNIAPLQGFIIERNGEAAGMLNFNLLNISSEKSGTLKSAKLSRNKLDIVAKSDKYSIRTFIAEREDGSSQFSERDSRKLINNLTEIPEIYTLKPSDKGMVAVGANIINAGDCEYPLGLATTYNGNITFSFSGMDSYNARIFFADKYLNKTIELTGLDKYEYSFTNETRSDTETGNLTAVDDRFTLRLASATASLEDEFTLEHSVKVYNQRGHICVFSVDSDLQEVKVYNLNGTLIYGKNGINLKSYVSESSFSMGVYIVEVKTDKNVTRKKIIINNI